MDFDVIGLQPAYTSRPRARRVDDNVAVVNRPVVHPNTGGAAIFNYDRVDRRAFEQMRARSGRSTRVRLGELAIVDPPIVRQMECIDDFRRDCGLDSTRFGGRKFLDRGVRLALPSRALFQFRTLLRVQRQVENAGAVVLRIDAALGDKAVHDRLEYVARTKAQFEQRPRLIRLGLRRDQSGRRPRRFLPDPAALENGHGSAVARKPPRNRTPDNSAADNENLHLKSAPDRDSALFAFPCPSLAARMQP